MDHQSIVQKFQNYAACDVADALTRLKHPNGGLLADLNMFSPQLQAGPTKIVGPAYTVRFVRNNPITVRNPSPNYIDNVPSGSVIFLSAPPRIVNAVYGGLMSLRAKTRGAVGTVVDGRIRDLQEHRDLEYGVWARATSTTAATEVCRPSEINIPVRLQSEDQEAWVNPGDWIIADLDGVVCCPKDMVERVFEIIEGMVEADRRVAADLAKGRSVADAFKEHRGR